MARSGALIMFIVTGITAFTRTTLDDGVVVALIALAASLVVVCAVVALIKRSPAGIVARAMSPGTPFERRLERVLPVLNDWTMALLGPGFVAMGALGVASGFGSGS
ncbi:hypothetical protein [Candidatus Solirubrobacter pratensis]|uniref:hypothetical protein n=1 Tax=Candidatus Solirubrobacter pratensis TaxID=1298857 RepID=UPI00040173D9|nr:hypothetical protein [Candidatus Solirubrobacter pratensis]